MSSVRRLLARVSLDKSDGRLESARARAAAGDESWERWVAEHERGEAIIVRLAVRLEISDGVVVETANRGVFLELDSQPPKIEQQVAELVGKDFSALSRELAARGHHVERHELETMYVHVELGEDVVASLASAGTTHGRAPEADPDLSRHENPPSAPA